MNRKTPLLSATDLTDEELLALYLSLPEKQRGERFTDTTHAAQITGLSVRTIQFWIESGAIQAVVIGRKYRVYIDSLKGYLKAQMDKRKK